jgi:hypothetical protein
MKSDKKARKYKRKKKIQKNEKATHLVQFVGIVKQNVVQPIADNQTHLIEQRMHLLFSTIIHKGEKNKEERKTKIDEIDEKINK